MVNISQTEEPSATNDSRAPAETHQNNHQFGLTDREKYVAVVVYSLIMLFSFVGNTLVIFVVLRFKHMRKMHMNYLIMNLAIADLLAGTVCTFFTYMPMLVNYPGPYLYGDLVCKFTGFAQMASVFASSYTLVVMSIDRYFAIVFPMKTSLMMTHRGARRAIVATWAASAIICSPMLPALRVIIYPNDVVCTEKWPDGFIGTAFNLMFSGGFIILQYFVPLLVLLLTYGAIFWDLWRPAMSVCRQPRSEATAAKHQSSMLTTVTDGDSGFNSNTNAGTIDDDEKRRLRQPSKGRKKRIDRRGSASAMQVADERRDVVKKMLPMVILMSAAYAVCWFPLNIFSNVLYPLGLVPYDIASFLRVFWACHTLAMAHCFVNPVLLWLQSRRYREGFRYTIRRLTCRQAVDPRRLMNEISFQPAVISCQGRTAKSRSSGAA